MKKGRSTWTSCAPASRSYYNDYNEIYYILTGFKGDIVQSAIEGRYIIAKLEDGEEVFECIEKLIHEHGLSSGIILSGIGMLRNLEIGYFNGKEYDFKGFSEPMELLSMHGSITTKPEPVIHIHVSLGNNTYEVVGGHLKSGIVNSVNEISILKLQDVELTRELNENTGLKELNIK